MASPELTARIDALRVEVAALIDNPKSKLTPKQKAAGMGPAPVPPFRFGTGEGR